MNTKQLLKKNGEKNYSDIFPYNYIQNINDNRDNEKLVTILDRVNHLIISASTTTKQEARLNIPSKYRRHGLWISYYIDKHYTEYFKGNNQDATIDTVWQRDDMWQSVFDVEQYYPDEEDLTVIDNKLQFKNNEYKPDSYSGMGRVYIRKNIQNGVNYIYQSIFSKPNTIYIIRYDFDLAGNTIILPENCTLDFYGGSLRNGKLILNNTRFLHIPVNYNDILKVDVEGTVAEGQIVYVNGKYKYWNGTKWVEFLTNENQQIDIIQNRLTFTHVGGTQTINIAAVGNWTLKVINDSSNNIQILNNILSQTL